MLGLVWMVRMVHPQRAFDGVVECVMCLQVLSRSPAGVKMMQAGAVVTATYRCRSPTSWPPAPSTGRHSLVALALFPTYVSSPWAHVQHVQHLVCIDCGPFFQSQQYEFGAVAGWSAGTNVATIWPALHV
jgi:hypothetical protein